MRKKYWFGAVDTVAIHCSGASRRGIEMNFTGNGEIGECDMKQSVDMYLRTKKYISKARLSVQPTRAI